ncbi:hypothetical protein [Lysobacter olei]
MSDLLTIPHDRIDVMLRDLRYALEMAHLVGGDSVQAMRFETFDWTDDGERSVDVKMNGEKLCRLEVMPACWCLTCDPVTVRMALCPDCGNKRCPKANDHRHACTGSNEPGQKGSAWEHVKP